MGNLHDADLDRMTALIAEDCRYFGIEESRIENIRKDILIKGFNNDDYSFEYREETGYTLTFRERGQCNWGISAFDEMDFRFLVQLHVVHHATYSPDKIGQFLSAARERFGQTEEYQKALALIQKRKRI